MYQIHNFEMKRLRLQNWKIMERKCSGIFKYIVASFSGKPREKAQTVSVKGYGP
jgi:hypothetical protein